MRIIRTNTDIFQIPDSPASAVCVTTNGMIRNDGRAVMGAGIAKQADRLFNLAPKLARYLRQYGNRVFDMGVYMNKDREYRIITFPTKHDWRDASDADLIRQSCIQLVELCDARGYGPVYLTPPGCSNGRLDWETQVRPIIEPLLDDRFVVIIRTP